MSSSNQEPLTCDHIRHWPEGKPLLALTAYDYPVARLLDEAGVDILHVGDTLGMVVLGLPDTTGVTMSDMLHHVRPVARARKRALITADLPIHTYETPQQAVENSLKLVQAGADAVKMEGGSEILDSIKAVLDAGIQVQGHLGMLPQHILEEGRYRKKGREHAEAEKILRDAQLLEEAGVFSFVLESVVADLAEQITRELHVPTIGIGSGNATVGQILVIHDVVGLYPWFVPPFVKPQANFASEIQQAVRTLKQDML